MTDLYFELPLNSAEIDSKQCVWLELVPQTQLATLTLAGTPAQSRSQGLIEYYMKG